MSENHSSDSRLSFGLAFVGGYCDAAGYVLAKTFTGHITGAMVLAAISVAGHDWGTSLRHMLAIALFLTGVVLIPISERFLARTPSRFLLPAVMGVEIVLISTAYFALTSHLTAKFGLFVGCMSLALGLQNGAFSQAGGISVHTTYLTGMITSLLKTATERRISQTTTGNEPTYDQKVKLLGGIWLAFFLGATVGAAMVFWFGALGLVGAAFLLLAMVIGVSVSRGRGAEQEAHRKSFPEELPSHKSAINDHRRRKSSCRYSRQLWLLFLVWFGLCVFTFWLIPRLRKRNRSPALTVTKRVRARTAISWGTGAASGRAWRNAV